MRFKRGSKVEIMNKNNVHAYNMWYNDARLQKQKRSSPFHSSLHESKKVKPAWKKVKSQSQSQKHVSCDSFIKVDTLSRESEPNESIASCSVPNDNLSSDGESFNTSRVKIEASIHRLELHAYRSTLKALYASGPLSWEKEALLTNLRINLNISNDEHLTELRLLISAGSRILD